MNLYDIHVLDEFKNDVSLSKFKGKVLLIVNTATECGFTPQYQGLQSLYEHYGPRGFEILDFPCNQFAGQAPAETTEIKNFCQGKFGVTFSIFDKIEVNGKNASPLYVHLKRHLELPTNQTPFQTLREKLKRTLLGSRIKWNFTKFLVDKEGHVVERFSPTTTPEALKPYIEKYL